MKKIKKYVPKVETCEFVAATDLFDGLGDLWDEFIQCCSSFTWGGNNRSLVTADDILEEFASHNIEHPSQLEILRKRANTLPEGLRTYVDLEN
jgi:hypothetical protein